MEKYLLILPGILKAFLPKKIAQKPLSYQLLNSYANVIISSFEKLINIAFLIAGRFYYTLITNGFDSMKSDNKFLPDYLKCYNTLSISQYNKQNINEPF